MQGESAECSTLNIFWRDVSLPSSLYVISAGDEYQKAWHWALSTRSGKLEWDLALPAGNRFLVTVAGRQYAGFEGPRTVAASSDRGCLSARAREVSRQRAAQSEPRGGMSQGAIIGTALGSAALALIAALVVWLIRRRRATAVRPGEINLQDEWQSMSQDHNHVLPFLQKPKTEGNVAPSEAGRGSVADARTPVPQQEIDAEAPMHMSGPAPPSYNHVLWVTQPPDVEAPLSPAFVEAKSAILAAPELSRSSSSSTAAQQGEHSFTASTPPPQPTCALADLKRNTEYLHDSLASTQPHSFPLSPDTEHSNSAMPSDNKDHRFPSPPPHAL